MYTLKLKALSAHTCLAKGAIFTAAAMRCGYDGFEEIEFTQPNSIEKQLGAMIKDASHTRGLSKLIGLGKEMVKEITQTENIDFGKVPLYICLQDSDRPSAFSVEELQEKLFTLVMRTLEIPDLHPSSRAYLKGKSGFVHALADAQKIIYQEHISQVLILSIDSLLNNPSLSYFGGGLYGEGCRLLTEDNSNGFIPGEAATAILLSKPTGEENEVIISGVGTAREPATIYNDDEVLRAKGMSEAIMMASKQASLPIHKTAFRVGSMSGEEYFFDEATLAQQKTLKQKIPDHPLWHPADSIGEVGSAIGGAMVIQTYYAMIHGYAPGDNAICHLSNDDQLRGAFIIQHTHKTPVQKRETKNLEGMYFSDIIKSQLKHDAPYAWFLLDQSKNSPLFLPKDIQRLQERLDSYVACFILSHRANDSLLSILQMHDWGAVYVTARVGLDCHDKAAFNHALESVSNKQQSRELSNALCYEAYHDIEEILSLLIGHENLWVRVAAIETLKHKQASLDDAVIRELLDDKETEVKVAILKLIGEYKLEIYHHAIIEHLTHENQALRYAATYAGCFLQMPRAYSTLQAFCLNPNPYLREALNIQFHIIQEEHIPKLLQEVSVQISSPRIKAYTLAIAGLLEAIPLLLKQMQKLEDTKYCAEAFSIITGVDLEAEDLSRGDGLSDEEEALLLRTQKEDKESAFYEDNLPLPDVALLEKWWQKHKDQFISGRRYLAGKMITEENLRDIQQQANQIQSQIASMILKLKF